MEGRGGMSKSARWADVPAGPKKCCAREISTGGRSTEWPADQVERCPIGRLVPYARHARTHSDVQVDQIAASIRDWGWTNPVLVVERGTNIAGRGRVVAAQKLGIADCPVITARGW